MSNNELEQINKMIQSEIDKREMYLEDFIVNLLDRHTYRMFRLFVEAETPAEAYLKSLEIMLDEHDLERDDLEIEGIAIAENNFYEEYDAIKGVFDIQRIQEEVENSEDYIF